MDFTRAMARWLYEGAVSVLNFTSVIVWKISDFLSILIPTGKSQKQNPKIGFVTERHLWKQNPDNNLEYLVKSLIFGCVTERHLRDPILFYERFNHSALFCFNQFQSNGPFLWACCSSINISMTSSISFIQFQVGSLPKVAVKSPSLINSILVN